MPEWLLWALKGAGRAEPCRAVVAEEGGAGKGPGLGRSAAQQRPVRPGQWDRAEASCAAGTMPSYTVTVATGSQWFAGTDDYVYLSLEGTEGCSERHLLDKPFYNDFERGAVSAGGRRCPLPRLPAGLRCLRSVSHLFSPCLGPDSQARSNGTSCGTSPAPGPGAQRDCSRAVLF